MWPSACTGVVKLPQPSEEIMNIIWTSYEDIKFTAAESAGMRVSKSEAMVLVGWWKEAASSKWVQVSWELINDSSAVMQVLHQTVVVKRELRLTLRFPLWFRRQGEGLRHSEKYWSEAATCRKKSVDVVWASGWDASWVTLFGWFLRRPKRVDPEWAGEITHLIYPGTPLELLGRNWEVWLGSRTSGTSCLASCHVFNIWGPKACRSFSVGFHR